MALNSPYSKLQTAHMGGVRTAEADLSGFMFRGGSGYVRRWRVLTSSPPRVEERGMMHWDRRYTIRPVATVEELAELLANHVWSETTGFDLNGTVFLNVSTSPDAIQEYTVIKDDRRLESISLGGLHASAIAALVAELIQSESAAPQDRCRTNSDHRPLSLRARDALGSLRSRDS